MTAQFAEPDMVIIGFRSMSTIKKSLIICLMDFNFFKTKIPNFIIVATGKIQYVVTFLSDKFQHNTLLPPVCNVSNAENILNVTLILIYRPNLRLAKNKNLR